MKFKIDFKFVLFLILGAIASISMYTFLNLDNVQVLVAKQDIAPNTIITKDMLSAVTVDKNYMPEGYVLYNNQNAILGGTTKYGLAKGNYVTDTQFYTQEELEMEKSENAGNVYFMVPLDKLNAVNGTLKVGDHINIMSSFTISDKDMSTQVAKRVFTFLQNIEVKQLSYDANDEVNGVIVLVPPEDAQKVAYAITYGSGLYAAKTPINYQENEIDVTTELEFIDMILADQNGLNDYTSFDDLVEDNITEENIE